MLVVYAGLLFVAAMLTARAPDTTVHGRTDPDGLVHGLLLLAAVPPLIIGFPAARTHPTVVILNICLFGAVAAGRGRRPGAAPRRISTPDGRRLGSSQA
jgi:hypothetical protein